MPKQPQRKSQVEEPEKKYDFRKYNPYRMILWFGLFGISSLFVGLVSAFLLSNVGDWQALRPPKAFLASTLILGASSFTMAGAQKAFRLEDRKKFRWMVIGTALLGIAFLVSQTMGWYDLTHAGINIRQSIGGSYLYLISGMHAMHILAGMGFFGWFMAKALRNTNHVGTALFYFTDPNRKLQLDLMAIYWHFMDGIWLFLMIVFLWQFL